MKKYNYQKFNGQLSNVNCRNSGFTLIEMLVVFTITAILVIGFLNKFQLDNRAENNLVAQEIVFYFKDTKQRILNNNLEGVNPAVDCKSGKCILGINFINGSEYNIFIDRNNPPNNYFDSEDLIIKSLVLPDKINYISDISSITFAPPYGVTSIFNSEKKTMDCSSWCEIKILDQNSNEVIIKINDQGLPYVE